MPSKNQLIFWILVVIITKVAIVGGMWYYYRFISPTIVGGGDALIEIPSHISEELEAMYWQAQESGADEYAVCLAGTRRANDGVVVVGSYALAPLGNSSRYSASRLLPSWCPTMIDVQEVVALTHPHFGDNNCFLSPNDIVTMRGGIAVGRPLLGVMCNTNPEFRHIFYSLSSFET